MEVAPAFPRLGFVVALDWTEPLTLPDCKIVMTGELTSSATECQTAEHWRNIAKNTARKNMGSVISRLIEPFSEQIVNEISDPKEF
jgi:hypothetical protein